MRAAVLGSPIAHSLSPALHRAAYDALGLDWSYDALEVTESELPGFLAGLDDSWVGLSLTMPLKTAVLPLLRTQSDLVTSTQAANTVLLPGLQGDNTDVAGIIAALAERGVAGADRPVVLGGGATARSTIAALQVMGCGRPVAVVRSEPAVPLAADVVRWAPHVLGGCDLLVSTLPAGAADRIAEHVRDVPALLDVVYDPWPTALGRACSGVVVGGAAMLLHQAAAQVTLMTGLAAPLPAMRAALKHLAPPAEAS